MSAIADKDDASASTQTWSANARAEGAAGAAMIDADLLLMADQMRTDMTSKEQIENRKWHLKTYKQCFLHDDGMAWLRQQVMVIEEKDNRSTSSRTPLDKASLEEKAAQLGNLMIEAGYMSHVKDTRHHFKPRREATLFFKFYHKVIEEDLQLYSALQEERRLAALAADATSENSSVTAGAGGTGEHAIDRFFRRHTESQKSQLNAATNTNHEPNFEAGLDKLRSDTVTTQTNLSLLSEACIVMTNLVGESHYRIIRLESAVLLLVTALPVVILGQSPAQHDNVAGATLGIDFNAAQVSTLVVILGCLIIWNTRRVHSWERHARGQMALLECLSSRGFTEEFIESSHHDDRSTLSELSADAPMTRRISHAAQLTRQRLMHGKDADSNKKGDYGSVSKNDASSGTEKGLLLRTSDTLPAPSEWPHYPVMVCLNTAPSTNLSVPKYSSGPVPIGKAFKFESEMFVGSCLLRFKDIPGDNEQGVRAYFDGRQRRFQAIVQGRFKKPLNVGDVLTGHEFDKPFQYLPPSWMTAAGTSLIKRLAPGVVIDLKSNKPTFLACLAATSQSVSGDMPGNEPDIYANDVEEDCSVFGKQFSSLGQSIPASRRKKILSDPGTAQKYTYDTDTVYTFDFFQHLLDVSTYSLDIGITKFGIASSLNGQPIQIMAKTRQGQYLWSFLIYHQALLDAEAESSSDTK
jgi:hypothetical protein